MKNALTIDLEDYYQVSAFAKGASVDHWEGFTSRIEQNTEKLLSLFEGEKRKATFFHAWLGSPKISEACRANHRDRARDRLPQ